MAIQSISTQAFMGLGGTLLQNRWADIDGYLYVVRGHPYDSEEEFIATIHSIIIWQHAPPPLSSGTFAIAKLLQRFFMAFTMIRPHDSIQVPPCGKNASSLKLPANLNFTVDHYTEKFRMALLVASKDERDITNGECLGLRCPGANVPVAPPSELKNMTQNSLVNLTVYKTNSSMLHESTQALPKPLPRSKIPPPPPHVCENQHHYCQWIDLRHLHKTTAETL